LNDAEKDLENLFESTQPNLHLNSQLMFFTKTFKTSSKLTRSTLSSYQDLPSLSASSFVPSSFILNQKLQSLELNFFLNRRSLNFSSTTDLNFNTSLSFLNNFQT